MVPAIYLVSLLAGTALAAPAPIRRNVQEAQDLEARDLIGFLGSAAKNQAGVASTLFSNLAGAVNTAASQQSGAVSTATKQFLDPAWVSQLLYIHILVLKNKLT